MIGERRRRLVCTSLHLVGRCRIVSCFEMMGSDAQELPLLVPSHRQVADDLCRADACGQSTIDGRLDDLGIQECELDHHADVPTAFPLTRRKTVNTINAARREILQPSPRFDDRLDQTHAIEALVVW